MSENLFDLLRPHLRSGSGDTPGPSSLDAATSKYLSRLSKLDLNALQSSESQSLAQSNQSNLLALQALSSRSTKSLISTSDHLTKLGASLPSISKCARDIREGVGKLDGQAVAFSEKYSRSTDTPSDVLDRRKRALLLARNAERVADTLELPTLLSSAVHSAAASVGASATTNTYNAALDLHGHIKRLTALHPDSGLVQDIGSEGSRAMREMTASLIQTLRGPNLKLAGGMRTVGWLRRVAPELVSASRVKSGSGDVASIGASEEEGSLGALFLVCRLGNLLNTLDALEPLKELADQESRAKRAGRTDAGGHQTERYLKRFVELFREQSFAIVSMFRSIFPADEEASEEKELGLDFNKMGLGNDQTAAKQRNKPEPLPSALSTFPLHLVSNVLLPTIRSYLPNIADRSAKDSLLTQVLYCAGSLGRLGGDFSLLLVDLYDTVNANDGVDEDDKGIEEWVEIMQKHRVQAARLESMASTSSGGFASIKSRPKEGITA